MLSPVSLARAQMLRSLSSYKHGMDPTRTRPAKTSVTFNLQEGPSCLGHKMHGPVGSTITKFDNHRPQQKDTDQARMHTPIVPKLVSTSRGPQQHPELLPGTKLRIEILGAQISQKKKEAHFVEILAQITGTKTIILQASDDITNRTHLPRLLTPARDRQESRTTTAQLEPSTACRSVVVAPLVAAEHVLGLRVAEGAAADDVDEDERDGGGEQRHAGPAPLLPELPQHAGLAGAAAVAELPRVVAPRRAVRVRRRVRRGARPRRRGHVREPARRRRLAAPGLHAYRVTGSVRARFRSFVYGTKLQTRKSVVDG
jgi:hypothetical protein